MTAPWHVGLFIAAYTLFLLGSGQIVQKAVRDRFQRGTIGFALRIIGLALPLAPVVFVWTLTGFFSTAILVVVFIATLLSALLSGLFRAITTVPGIDTSAGFLWLSGDQSSQLRKVGTFVFGIGVSFVLLYPVAAIIGYLRFRDDHELVAPTVIAIVFLFAGIQVALGMLSNMVSLLSENLDENSRTDGFIGQIAKAPMLTAFLAIGALSASPGTFLSPVGLLFRNIGTWAAASLAVVAVITGSIPYMLGRIRARRWREVLQAAKRIWLVEILGRLELSPPTEVGNILRAVGDAAAASIEPMIALDPRLRAMTAIDGGEQPENDDDRFNYAVYSRVRFLDPRIAHITFMLFVRGIVYSIASTIESATFDSRRALSLQYGDSLRRWTLDLKPLADSERRVSNSLLAAFGVLAGGAAAAFAAEAGKWAWTAVAIGQ